MNGTTLKKSSEGVYSGTITSAQHLSVAIFSNFESLTEYNLKCTITFSYPQTVASYLNITPFYHDLKEGDVYLAEIGKINSSSGSALTYRKKSYYDEQQPYLPAFNHGGYLCGPFGGSVQSQTLVTDFTYQFQNNTVDYMGLYMECGNSHSSGSTGLSMFPTTQRDVTVTIDYFDAVEKATIENAEATKGIFEWLQDGLTNLLIPTSDGFQDMVMSVNTRLQTESGILTLPLNFVTQCVANLFNALGGQLNAVFHLPKFEMEMSGTNNVIWEARDFNLNSGIVQHLFNNSQFVLYVQCGTAFCIFLALIKTASEITLQLLDIRDLTQTFEDEEE